MSVPAVPGVPVLIRLGRLGVMGRLEPSQSVGLGLWLGRLGPSQGVEASRCVLGWDGWDGWDGSPSVLWGGGQ